MAYIPPTPEEVRAVDLSWKRYILPEIHPEGKNILWVEFGLFAIFAGAGVLGRYCAPLYAFWGLAFLFLLVIIFSFYFFRNPVRVPPDGENLILSPADGIVSNIKQMTPPPELGIGEEARLRISIFMSVFSVHVNRAPVTGKVTHLKYVPGKFVSVQDKDSEDNERQLIGMRASNGQAVGFVQIAGLVARRIYCPLNVGDRLAAGQVFGMIRFGSRLDVYLPQGCVPAVKLGQVATAGETILSKMES